MILPIGSVVYLKEGNQKIMILNRGAVVEQDDTQVYFDYTGALYPEQVYYFNREDIDEVIWEGHSDSDEKRYVKLYEKWLTSINGIIKQGKTK
ncbi:DUF4176 domain-containing protein [Streptococcus mitis]|uniref:DUF4176 domain-containing protein n=1 Tax=Streptococcus mitis TaxID=28037 RepID=UPI0021B6BEC1|nr:DUF4176 domain-containing protein [Streptococcus mitis]